MIEEKECKLMDVILYSDGKTADLIFYNLDGSITEEYKRLQEEVNYDTKEL